MSTSGRVTRFGLRNFKAFHYLEDIDLKPLTVLVGANSSGKSSIFQALLLLKQSSEAGPSGGLLKFNGDYTKLGSFASTVSNFDSSRTIEYRLGLELVEQTDYLANSYFTHMKPRAGTHLHVASDLTFLFDVVGDPPTTMLRQTTVASRPLGHPPSDQDVFLQYDATAPHLTHRNVGKIFGEFTPTSIYFDKFWMGSFHGPVKDMLLPYPSLAIEEPLELLRRLIEHRLEYLGPIRADPRAFYPVEEEPALGVRGEGTVPYLLGRQHTTVKYTASPASEIREAPLLEAVNDWLQRMKVTPRLTIDPVESIAFTAAVRSTSATTKSVNLSQVGFGISQLLPVLVMGLKSPEDAWLLFEQPESQLHPRLQGELGDFFLATARAGKTVMVETHSDHLVNRLRRRIAEDESGELAKMVQILFVHAGTPDNPSSYVEPLQVDETGTIVNGPADFFSETADETFAILGARRKRAGKAAP